MLTGPDTVHPAQFAGQRQGIQLAARTGRAFPVVHAPLSAQTRGGRRQMEAAALAAGRVNTAVQNSRDSGRVTGYPDLAPVGF
jgi:hypothetical protein